MLNCCVRVGDWADVDLAFLLIDLVSFVRGGLVPPWLAERVFATIYVLPNIGFLVNNS